MKTRNQWLQKFRKVKRGEKPSGFLNVTVPIVVHHEEVASDGSKTEWTTQETKTRQVGLYEYNQTVPFTKRCGTIYRTLFASYFISSRQKYIWRTEQHWVTCNGYLDDKKIRKHIEGKEIYGVRAGEFTNCIVIDLDLHNGCKEVATRQLDVILNHFHGSRKCHYSVSRSGVHVIIMLEKPTRTDAARAWLRTELQAIDTDELKELALSHNMRSISDMEIKPSKKDGWRLPFARGRVTYLDEPVEGNDAETFGRYIEWLVEPSYAPREHVFKFICDYLQEEEQTPQPQKKKVATAKKQTKIQGILGSLGKMKNCYRQKLVDFWNGKVTPADSLNVGIALTARMLPFYYDDADDAIDFIEELVDDLPDDSFSDRLSTGNRKEVSRVIRDTVCKVFDNNTGQPQVDESNVKLKFTKEAWDRAGFSLIDRATWDRASSSLGKYFHFIEPAQIKALSFLADILKVDLETCAEVTRQIIRIGHTERELSIGYFAKVLKSFGINVRHDGRVNQYLNALTQMGWLIKIREYWAGGSRARTYIAGNEFYPQVRNTSSPTPAHTHVSSISVPLYVDEDDLALAMGRKMPPMTTEEQSKPPPWTVFASSAC